MKIYFSEPYDEVKLSIYSYVPALEQNMLGDNLRYAKDYSISVDGRDTDLEVEAGFLGEGVWSDPNSAMEVSCFLQLSYFPMSHDHISYETN